MKSRQLVHFLAVYDLGSASAAAKILHITQPALTKSLRQLESTLNVPLFERSHKGLLPTKYGHLLARHSRTINLEVDQAMAELRMMRDGLAGRLTVGGGAVWLERYLPPVIAELNRRRPNLTIHMVGGVRHLLIPGVIKGSIDVACMMMDGPDHEGIIKKPLFEMHHVLVVREGHPLASPEAFEVQRLAEFPWVVLRDDEAARMRLATFMSANDLPAPFVAVQSTSITNMLRIVREGDFLAHVPDRLLPLVTSLGVVPLPFDEHFWSGSAGLVYRAAPEPSAEVRAFLEIVEEYAVHW